MVDSPKRLRHLTRRVAVVSLAVVAVPMTFVTLSLASGGAQPGRVLTPRSTSVSPVSVANAVRASVKVAPVAPAVTPAVVATPTPVTTTPVNAPVPAATVTATEPSVSTLVAEVEAAGVEPGSNWTWVMGDTATHCGVITGAGTGCTFGAGGLEQSIFAGSPNLNLVAHELANAETQNDAVPSLLNEVAAAAGGTSWSPTDAVASCLVEHFMGFQDNAAGTWQCPSALATVVADNIHDTI